MEEQDVWVTAGVTESLEGRDAMRACKSNAAARIEIGESNPAIISFRSNDMKDVEEELLVLASCGECWVQKSCCRSRFPCELTFFSVGSIFFLQTPHLKHYRTINKTLIDAKASKRHLHFHDSIRRRKKSS